MKTLILDTECYRNFYLIAFKDVDTGKKVYLERSYNKDFDKDAVRNTLRNNRIISFNGNNYDIVTLSYALKEGVTTSDLKDVSDAIIRNNMKPWVLEGKYGFRLLNLKNHIDIIEVAPGKTSLKTYGGRLHSPKMQDLPIEPDTILSEQQMREITEYCGNDLDVTEVLYRKLIPQIELRESLGKESKLDLRSKSDAQIAEAVIQLELTKTTGKKPEKINFDSLTSFRYKAPSFIKFETDNLKSLLTKLEKTDFYISDGGKLLTPDWMRNELVDVGGNKYQIGSGGLHSTEANQTYQADRKMTIIDRDVVSYYPAIILNCRLFPKHLGEGFLKVYKNIVDRRIAAKRSGDKVTADSLKITVNGTFGKLGSKYSFLFSPDLLIQTTVTGQLALLMVIERLTLAGFRVISANTDGVVTYLDRERKDEFDRIFDEFELDTGFETESTEYNGLFSRDVNNYIATKTDDGHKTKGIFVPPGLQKNPTNEVCSDAVVAFLKHGIDVADYIRAEPNITKFLNVRNVRGGAVKDGEYLGKVVRWYYSTKTKSNICYKVNGNKVPRSEGAMPMMQLTNSIPSDLDYEWYIREARSLLSDVGYI